MDLGNRNRDGVLQEEGAAMIEFDDNEVQKLCEQINSDPRVDHAFSDFRDFAHVKETTMELKDTVDLMNSADYKDRFKAEYFQTKLRYNRLHKMLVKKAAGTLDFEPACSIALLTEQKRYMGEYLRVLETRAEIEGISLE